MIRVNKTSLKVILGLILFNLLMYLTWMFYSWAVAYVDKYPNEIVNSFINHIGYILFLITIFYLKVFLNQSLNIFSLNKIITIFILLSLVAEVNSYIHWSFSEDFFTNQIPIIILGILSLIVKILFIVKLLRIESFDFKSEFKILGFAYLLSLIGAIALALPYSGTPIIYDLVNLLPLAGYLLLFYKAFRIIQQ